MQKNKANANANAWFLFQVLFPGSYSGGQKNDKNKAHANANANANANAWFLFQVLFPGSYSGGPSKGTSNKNHTILAGS